VIRYGAVQSRASTLEHCVKMSKPYVNALLDPERSGIQEKPTPFREEQA
jgi:hypothetical protein